MNARVPTPPPGFVLQELPDAVSPRIPQAGRQQGAVPPPPAGFVLDEQRDGAVQPAGDPNVFDALGYKLSQGVTLGLGDEIAAGLRTGAGMWGDYGEALDQERANLDAVSEKYPWLGLGAEIAGGVVTGGGLAKGGLSLAANAAQSGKGWFARLLGGAADGGLFAAAQGFGTGEGVEDRAERAAYNIPLGVTLGAAGEGLATGAGAALRRAFQGSDEVARSVNPAANVDEASQFGIPLSRAQATRSVPQANIENQLRAQGRMTGFDQAQREAVEQSVGTVQQRLAGGAPTIPNQTAAYEAVPGRLSTIRDRLKAASQDSYNASVNNPNVLVDGAAVASLPDFIRRSLDADQILVDPMYHQGAARALSFIDDYIGRIPPVGDDVKDVQAQLRWVENMRSSLRKNFPPIGQDAPALKAISRAIDGWTDEVFERGLVSASDDVLAELKNARAKWSDYLAMSEPRAKSGGKVNPQYEAQRAVRNIMSKEMSPEEIGQYLWGSSVAAPKNTSFMTAQFLRKQLGPDSPEWNAIRQSFWLRATRAGDEALQPAKVAKNLDGLLNGQGKSVAGALFSESERELMRRYASVMRNVSPAREGLNASNTANRLLPQLAQYGARIMGVLTGGGGMAYGMDPLTSVGLGAVTAGTLRGIGEAAQMGKALAATRAPVPANPSGAVAGMLRGGSSTAANAIERRRPLELTVTPGR